VKYPFNFVKVTGLLKGWFTKKINLSSFTHPHVVPKQ